MNAATVFSRLQRKNAWDNKILCPICSGLKDPRYNDIRLVTPLRSLGGLLEGRKMVAGASLHTFMIAPLMYGSSKAGSGGEVIVPGSDDDEELDSVASSWGSLLRRQSGHWPMSSKLTSRVKYEIERRDWGKENDRAPTLSVQCLSVFAATPKQFSIS